jgi:hypothetical protein
MDKISRLTVLLDVAIGLYTINGLLFSGLAYVYGRTALSTRARYPLGLFIFSVLLVFQSIGTAAAYAVFPGYFGSDVHPLMATMAAFEFIGATALVGITI